MKPGTLAAEAYSETLGTASPRTGDGAARSWAAGEEPAYDMTLGEGLTARTARLGRLASTLALLLLLVPPLYLEKKRLMINFHANRPFLFHRCDNVLQYVLPIPH